MGSICSPVIPVCSPVIPVCFSVTLVCFPVIPAKAGIQQGRSPCKRPFDGKLRPHHLSYGLLHKCLSNFFRRMSKTRKVESGSHLLGLVLFL